MIEDLDKAHCPTCGTPGAVNMADGWTQRLDDLYSEWCKGHEAGFREGAEDERHKLVEEAGKNPFEHPSDRIAWGAGAASGVAGALARVAYESMEVDFEVCGGCGTIIDIDAESCGCEYPPRGKTKTFYVISADTLNGANHG